MIAPLLSEALLFLCLSWVDCCKKCKDLLFLLLVLFIFEVISWYEFETGFPFCFGCCSFFGFGTGCSVGLNVRTSEESCLRVCVRFLLASANALGSSFGFFAGGSSLDLLSLEDG